MANKDLILKSGISRSNKAVMLLLCTAQEINSEISRELGKLGISQEQLQILHVLDESPSGELTVNEIKLSFVSDSPNVSRMLNKLVEKNLVTKRRDTQDQRVVYITITTSGRKMHYEADEVYLKCVPGLSENEADELLKILTNI